MRDELLTYYERELTFLRRSALGFAEKYPKVAGRLLLEPGKSEDPHVERLIEACAFLAARIHLKVDDEFPEITESFLQVLYPHYLCPIPSMSIAQFVLDPEQGKLATGYTIDRHRPLDAKPSGDTMCRFRTCYPVTLWPIQIASVGLGAPSAGSTAGSAVSALTLTLTGFKETRLAELDVDRLRVYLNGESQLVHRLYEMLFGHCIGIELRREGHAPVSLGRSALAEVGFGKDEGMLPYSSRSFLGYRLLLEYFHFPEKFFFFDVTGLSALKRHGFEQEASLVFLLDEVPRLDQKLEPHHFRLGCTPIVNLFEKTAEPIRLDHAHTQYHVMPSVRQQRTMEVYTVDSVKSLSSATGTITPFEPFYSFKHSFDQRRQRAFWHATRRPSERKDDPGTEVFLTLVDLDFRPTTPPVDVVSVGLTVTNRDLPGMLPFGDPNGDLTVEGAAYVRRIVCLTKPTRTVRPPLRHSAQWRLISHLSLNFLSPVEGGQERSPEVLQEILKLYDFTDSAAVQQQIQGLTGVSSRQVWRRVRSDRGSGFARGIEATIELDESKFVGTGVYLFSSVLEKFLALYVSINSFSETIATSQQRGLFKRWPPRSGLQPLL
jgi:type VI secretion system protein ImpG